MSSPSTSSSSSESLPRTSTRQTDSLFYKPAEKKEPKDWVKIGAIVAAVVGGLIAALAGSCLYGLFPRELLGGTLGSGITLVVGAAILLPAGWILFRKYFLDKDKEEELTSSP